MYNAQNRKISGTVLSLQADYPIENVNIFIKDKNIGTSTLRDGSFYLENIPEIDFELSFSIIGYQDTSFFVISNEEEINAGRLYLRLNVLNFDEINVAAHPELDNAQSLSSISLSGSKS